MKVRAIRAGFFNHIRRRGDDALGEGKGDVFNIPDTPRRKVRKNEEQQFDEVTDENTGTTRRILKRRLRPDSPEFVAAADKDGTLPVALGLWMLPVAKGTPEKTTTSPQALAQRTGELKAQKQAGGGAEEASTSEAEVI